MRNLLISVWISSTCLLLKLINTNTTMSSSSASLAQDISHLSVPSCMREQDASNSHPISIDVRDAINSTKDHAGVDFASIRMLPVIVRNRVNHHLPRKNLSHLNKSSTVLEMRQLSFDKKCVRDQIPKKLHWIWFGTEIPDKYVFNIEKSSLDNPGWEIFLWSEIPSQQLDERMQKHNVTYHFKNITKYINDGLFVNGDLIIDEPNPAGKSDYSRLEVIYLEGGIYQDTDSLSVQGFDKLFGDHQRWPFGAYNPDGYHKGTVCNCIFGFEKGSAFLSFALDLTRENCKAFDKCGVMVGAGPPFLTAAMYYYDDPDIVLYHEDYLSKKSGRSVVIQAYDGTWVEDYLKSNGGHWRI